MWERHRTKEIILFFVIVISSQDYYTDGRTPDERRRAVATPGYPVFRRAKDKTTAPPVVNSSEESEPSDNENDSDWPNFWEGLLIVESEKLQMDFFEDEKRRICYIIATTYMSALKDLRRYFIMKHLYENNLEYEVGYMTHEIISKYQRMLELFHMAQNRFFINQSINYAPSSYMLYLYTNVVEIATVIKHLCHMLNELETKYLIMPETAFSDYHLGPKKKPAAVNGTADFEKRMKANLILQKKIMKAKRKRAKARAKLMAKNLIDPTFKPTSPPWNPKKSFFPLIYGWSIEEWS